MAQTNAQRQAKWRANHLEQARAHSLGKDKVVHGLIRQALRNKYLELPQELIDMPTPEYTAEEIEAQLAKNVAKWQARAEKRRGYWARTQAE